MPELDGIGPLATCEVGYGGGLALASPVCYTTAMYANSILPAMKKNKEWTHYGSLDLESIDSIVRGLSKDLSIDDSDILIESSSDGLRFYLS